MGNKYTQVYSLHSKFYLSGSPVIIEAVALQKNNITGQIVGQVKIRNISEKKIIACKISVRAYEVTGKEIEGIPEVSLLDLDAKRGESFGTKIAIIMPSNTTRKTKVCVTEIVFEDGNNWTYKPCEWPTLSEPDKLSDTLKNPELIKEYESEIGEKCVYVPSRKDGLFFLHLWDGKSWRKCSMLSLRTHI